MQLWNLKSEYNTMKIIFINVILNLFQDLNIKETRCRNKFGMTRGITSGFTLIELLVAIGIIGILASFLLANFVGVRQRARDGVRKSDLRQIQSALELYRSDKGGYPTSGSSSGNFPTVCGSQFDDGASTPAIYMKKIPCDPSGGTAIYTYIPSNPNSDNTLYASYSLVACLENKNDSQKDAVNVSPCDGTNNFSYTLTNP